MGNALFYIVSVLLLIKFVENTSCPEPYSRFSTNHSVCLSPNSACQKIVTIVTPADIIKILAIHNAFRSTIATQQDHPSLPPACNMLQMEWDEELAAVAQAYANQCLFKHDCPNCRRVQNFGVGQNLAMQSDSVQKAADWEFAVARWFEEIVYFSKDLVCSFVAPNDVETEYRHFSQVIWADTFRVGCGFTLYKEGDMFNRLYVCNYGPGGNIYETCVYNAGAPCSQCPENTRCGVPGGWNFYPGLCQRINNQAPLLKNNEPTIFNCDFQDPTYQDCVAKVLGNWYTVQTLAGNYLEIVLQPGESGTVTFLKSITPLSKNTFCVEINYRKGPLLEKDPQSNTAKAIFVVPSMNDYTFTQVLGDYDSSLRLQFSKFKLTLQWENPTTMTISFAVPFGATPQFLNIDSIKVKEDSCQN